ncbi:unnamed protein product [Cochlearia groenlandica]
MPPPAARSDRSAPPGGVSQVAQQRPASRREGSSRGPAHHAAAPNRTRGSEDRLLVVNAENRSDRERVSNLFRTFSYQGLEIPVLENMRDPVRDLYARHSIALAERGDYPDLEAEAASMAEDLPVVEAKLAAMPLPSMDLVELARRFDDSPPPEDAVGCESALVLVEPQAVNEDAPLEVIPLASASFDQFGSMTTSLTVEDALNLREGIRPEGSEPPVTGPAEGGQEVAIAEEESLQLGAGESGAVDEEGQT